jgi:hypothetical protein
MKNIEAEVDYLHARPLVGLRAYIEKFSCAEAAELLLDYERRYGSNRADPVYYLLRDQRVGLIGAVEAK